MLSLSNKTNEQEKGTKYCRVRQAGVVVGRVRSEMDGERLTPGTQPRGKALHHMEFRAGSPLGHLLREKPSPAVVHDGGLGLFSSLASPS